MSAFLTNTLGALSLLAGASLLAGLIATPAWGWALLAVGLGAMLAFHLLHITRLAKWLEQPSGNAVPEGHGSWDGLLTALHRHERDTARRERALGEALIRFRRAAQALPDGVVILDADHRIEWCNGTAAAQLGLDARADVGRAIGNLVRAPVFLDYLATPDPATVPPVRVSLGHEGVLSLQLIPYGEAQKLLLVRDVTQAERLETMRRDFVANVSHELRTPLTVLVGFLETVRELKLDPQRTRDYLAMMQEQAARMQRIIEDLLTLSHLESAPSPAAERVRIAPLLERVRADAEALSKGRHRISVEAAAPVDLLGSESELASAFGNLATNAVRYTPEGGEIRLAWRSGDEGPVFAVQDTGVGIAPEHLPRLTERFYRVDRSRSRETGGTGLGLAIVKHALARHQASLDIESHPGRGSRFTARFPSQRAIPAQGATETSRN